MSPRRQQGMALIAMLIFLAVTAVATASLIRLGEAAGRRHAEAALLDIGQEFADALDSYRRATPAGGISQPATLDALLRDDRAVRPLRHLRKRYADPVSGSDQWGLVRDPQTGRIVGIHSLSGLQPLKQGGFPPHLSSLSGRTSYSGWVFTALLSLQMARGGPGASGGSVLKSHLVSPLESMVPESASSPPATPKSAAGITGSPLDLLDE